MLLHASLAAFWSSSDVVDNARSSFTRTVYVKYTKDHHTYVEKAAVA